MSQPRIIEVGYEKFLRMLQQATDSKQTIDKTNKEAWMRFVRKHDVPEGGMAVYAKAGAMSGNTERVIIDGAGAADGYYIYSSEDRFCLKYEVGSE
jgi:hypothetical protein